MKENFPQEESWIKNNKTILILIFIILILLIVYGIYNVRNRNSYAQQVSTEAPAVNDLQNMQKNVIENTKYKTGTDKQTELTRTETKYGVVIKTYTTTTYDVYNDESKIPVTVKVNKEYDKKNYKATTNEILTEARNLKNKNSDLINSVLQYCNQYRKQADEKEKTTSRKDLILDNELCIAACVRAIEIAYSDNFSHKRPDGSSFYTVLDDMKIKYSSSGENIANKYKTAKTVSEEWRNSTEHYSNIVNQHYSKIGIGVINFEDTYYWVQLFTN